MYIGISRMGMALFLEHAEMVICAFDQQPSCQLQWFQGNQDNTPVPSQILQDRVSGIKDSHHHCSNGMYCCVPVLQYGHLYIVIAFGTSPLILAQCAQPCTD